MTLLEQARSGVITDQMKGVARKEGLDPEFVRQGIAEGKIIIPRNKNRSGIEPLGIGANLRTKVNANVGSSRDNSDVKEELIKLCVAVKAGAHTVMDLSTGGDLDEVRKAILEESKVPIGTVPIYQAVIETISKGEKLVDMSEDDLFEVIERQGEQGVDFITVHCGVTMDSVERLKREGRTLDVVSRGGSFSIEWMKYNDKENPLYEHFDRLLDIARSYDMVLSLGDGLRPGCLADATDRGQVQELIILGELACRAWNVGVQVMIEGPGHMPMDQIEANVLLQKRLCHGAPFYVLGPLVTDIAPGYDHITAAIGGAIAARAGADFLCYVTPSEHLRLPTVEDVRQGVIASRIAAHAADIAGGLPHERDADDRMGKARKKLDWDEQFQLALDPERAKKTREENMPLDEDVCTMCSEFCAIKISGK